MDELNNEIWTNGLNILSGLAQEFELPDASSNGDIRPQQISPKAGHEGIFGPQKPLPMVPDFVGDGYGKKPSDKKHPSIMICGSAYAGFLNGYSTRTGISAEAYARCRNNPDPNAGWDEFMQLFWDSIIQHDNAYYGKILSFLGTTTSFCLTDLCKASLVRIRIDEDGFRHDEPGDGVVREGFNIYKKLVQPDWIYKRMMQADLIIALGSLAEQGLAYSFWKAHEEAKISLNTDRNVAVPDGCMDHLRTGYLHKDMNLGAWNNDQCWVMTNPERDAKHPILMRPIYHPAHGQYPEGLLSDILHGLHING